MDDDDISFMTEDHTECMDNDVESIATEVSKLTFGEETAATGRSFRTTQTGFKSILYNQKRDGKSLRNACRRKSRTVYGSKDVRVPYICDVWSSKRS